MKAIYVPGRTIAARLIAAGIFAIAAGNANASFETSFNSVRAESMGASSLASIGEAPSLFMNAAGLGSMRTGDASFMYDKMYAGLPGVDNLGVGFIAVAMPTRYGSFGVGMGDFMAAGLKEERTIALSYAQNIGGFLQLGVTGKHLYNHYAIGGDALAARDPVFSNGTSKSALGLDLGAVAAVGGPMKVGLSIRNVNRPDVGLATSDQLPREVQAGLIYDVSGIGLRATGDMLYTDGSLANASYKALPALGLEKALGTQGFMMRLGANPMEFTGGIGMRLGRIGFDYGFAMSRTISADNAGSHRVGMNMKIGEGTDSFADQSSKQQYHKNTANDDDFDYLNLDNKALFGR